MALLELYEVDLSVVPAVLLVDFFFFPFLWVLSGFPWFLLCSPRRRLGRAPSLFPVSLVFLRGVAGLRERRWELYFGHFYGISELRGARQVERFAQCSFRHLPQVVFHLAGSLGVFLRFAAPDPGGC